MAGLDPAIRDVSLPNGDSSLPRSCYAFPDFSLLKGKCLLIGLETKALDVFDQFGYEPNQYA